MDNHIFIPIIIKKNIYGHLPVLKLSYIFLWMMFSLLPCLATTYYVDKNHPNANNANPGTENLPWLTIQHAVDVVEAGDIVYVKAGLYSERVDLTGTNGTEGNSGNETNGYITYEAFPGDSVILDGTSYSSWGSAFMSGKWAGGSRAMDYIQLKNFIIRNYPDQGITFENDSADPSNSVGSHHIIIENVTVYNNGNVGILFEGGTEPNGTSHDIIIRGCRAHNNNNHGIKFTGDAAGIYNREHIHDSSIENCISHDNLFMGIHVSTGNYNIIVRNNSSYNNGRQGIGAHEIWDSVYMGNHVYSNGQGPESEDEGIVVWSSRNVSITRNIIHNNPGYGLKFWNDLNGSSHTAHNNVIYYNGEGGLLISTNVNNSKFYHNTLASNQGVGLNLNSSGSNNIIKNNVLYQNSVQVIPGNGNIFDYNLYFPDVSFSVKDIHYLTEDPLFINAGNSDFHLQPTSPAVDFGVDVGVNIDAEGNQRPRENSFDLGAYEMNLSPSSPSGLHVIH